jgi:Ca2+-binding RTX toxin-like protein
VAAYVANAGVDFNALALFVDFPDALTPSMLENQQSTGFDIRISPSMVIHVGGAGFSYFPVVGMPNPALGTVQFLTLVSGGTTLHSLGGLDIALSRIVEVNGPDMSVTLPAPTEVFAGDDTVTGSSQSDVLLGFGGNDTISGLGGHDTIAGGPGVDTMNGGAGNDTFLVDNPLDNVIESGPGLDTVRTTTSFSIAADATVEVLGAASPASTNTMMLTGNNLANPITGNNGVNRLTGGGGNDALAGLAGNDLVNGGAGLDRLTGGLGRDTMDGGAGADVFDFNSVLESRRGSALRDTINFFSHAQGDKIDLRTIDADVDGTAGNQAFRFIGGAAFSGIDGQLRLSGGLLQGDTNGDRVADFEVRVPGTLLAGDILL